MGMTRDRLLPGVRCRERCASTALSALLEQLQQVTWQEKPFCHLSVINSSNRNVSSLLITNRWMKCFTGVGSWTCILQEYNDPVMKISFSGVRRKWILWGMVRFWFTHEDSDEHNNRHCLVVTTGSDFSVLDARNVFRKIFIFPQSWEKVN